MKLFNLIQDNDIIVAEGVTFTDGRCALNWLNANYKKISVMNIITYKVMNNLQVT